MDEIKKNKLAIGAVAAAVVGVATVLYIYTQNKRNQELHILYI